MAEPNQEECQVRLGIAGGMRVIDRFDEAFATLDRAEIIARTMGLTDELARIHQLRGNLCFPLGRLGDCYREHKLALEFAQKADSVELQARAHGGLGDAEFARGHMVSAHHYYRRCVELARAQGLGSIEVAHLGPLANIQAYLGDLSGSLVTSTAAIDLAAQVNDYRAEITANGAAVITFITTGEFDRARPHAERCLTLARRLGAKRYEALALHHLAVILKAQRCRSEALELAHRALTRSQEASGFIAATILGFIAIVTDDPVERQNALAKGEEALVTALGATHLWFRRFAIEACLNGAAWDDAERHAAALEEYTRAEPLPWADMVIACGRALAAHGRNPRDRTNRQELARQRERAERANFGGLKLMIEQAIAAQRTASQPL